MNFFFTPNDTIRTRSNLHAFVLCVLLNLLQVVIYAAGVALVVVLAYWIA